MTFLAFTPLQALLVAALAAGAVVALYFLKLRHRRVVVSSAMLWGRVLDEQASHSLWERFRRTISIVVAVTIALLIELSLGRPQIEALTGKVERIVIVLDTSPSMNARTADGNTRWRHAVDKALALVDAAGPAAEFLVADTSGQTSSAATADRAEARRLIGELSPEGATPRFPDVDPRGSTVYLISDGVGVRNVPAFVRRLPVFEAAPNVAITAFAVRPVPANPLGYEAYLEIRNYGRPADVDVTVAGAGPDTVRKSVRLAADETLEDVFDLSSFEGGGVQASIRSKDDALAADDVAFAYLPVRRKTRTLLVTPGNSHLETLLKLDRRVELRTTEPRNYREAADVDAYVFDRFAPSTPPSKPALIIGAPAAPWLPRPRDVVQKPAITTWSDDHPIMQYVSVHDVSIQRATRIDSANVAVIAAAGETPLIVASTEKARWVMLTFELGASDLPLQSGFPMLIENVLAWLNREELALGRAPGRVELPLANAVVQTADGRPIPSEPQLGKTAFHAKEPGLYTAARDDTRLHVAVNLTNPDLSNINRSAPTGTSAGPPQPWLHHELWFYMVLAAMALMTAEWVAYHRRTTL